MCTIRLRNSDGRLRAVDFETGVVELSAAYFEEECSARR